MKIIKGRLDEWAPLLPSSTLLSLLNTLLPTLLGGDRENNLSKSGILELILQYGDLSSFSLYLSCLSPSTVKEQVRKAILLSFSLHNIHNIPFLQLISLNHKIHLSSLFLLDTLLSSLSLLDNLDCLTSSTIPIERLSSLAIVLRHQWENAFFILAQLKTFHLFLKAGNFSNFDRNFFISSSSHPPPSPPSLSSSHPSPSPSLSSSHPSPSPSSPSFRFLKLTLFLLFSSIIKNNYNDHHSFFLMIIKIITTRTRTIRWISCLSVLRRY